MRPDRGKKRKKTFQTLKMLKYRDRDAGGSLFIWTRLEYILAKVFKGIDQTALKS